MLTTVLRSHLTHGSFLSLWIKSVLQTASCVVGCHYGGDAWCVCVLKSYPILAVCSQKQLLYVKVEKALSKKELSETKSSNNVKT